MKIAIFLIGHLRTWTDVCRENTIDTFIDDNHHIDFFVETYNESFRKDYSVRKENNYCTILSNDEVKKLFAGLNVLNFSIEEQGNLPAVSGQKRKLEKCYETLKTYEEKNGTYDLVIRSRPDLFFEQKMDYDYLKNECSTNKIILGKEITDHINDTFAVGNSQNMRKYFNRFSLTKNEHYADSIGALRNHEIVLEEKIKHFIVRLSLDGTKNYSKYGYNGKFIEIPVKGINILENLFQNHYNDWREKRIKKIENILSVDFIKNKSILEIACGLGDIGNYFRTAHNCDVTFTEGRAEYIPVIRAKNPNSEIHRLNHEDEWNLNKKFDIVINFGILYHLYNWKQDLIRSLNHTDLLVLETEVADSDKPFFEYEFTDRNDYDQSLSETRKVKRVSANYIEHVLEENNFSFVRYDDEDLNSSLHIYNWKVTGSSEKENPNADNDVGRRRFWIARRK